MIIARVVEKTARMLNSKNDAKTACLGKWILKMVFQHFLKIYDDLEDAKVHIKVIRRQKR